MRFVVADDANWEPELRVKLEQDGNDVNIIVNGEMVAFFDAENDGALRLCTIGDNVPHLSVENGKIKVR